MIIAGCVLICSGVVRVAGVECNEPPVNHDWGLTTFDPSHPDTCKLGHCRIAWVVVSPLAPRLEWHRDTGPVLVKK